MVHTSGAEVKVLANHPRGVIKVDFIGWFMFKVVSEHKLVVFVPLAFQDLNSRAQAEVTIREALRELDLWGAAATFTLTEYTDSSSRTLTLIKDWKDIVNQVDKYVLAHVNTSEYIRVYLRQLLHTVWSNWLEFYQPHFDHNPLVVGIHYILGQCDPGCDYITDIFSGSLDQVAPPRMRKLKRCLRLLTKERLL